MKPIYSSRWYPRHNVLVWTPSPIDVIAQGAFRGDAKKRVRFSGPPWHRKYFYEPSIDYSLKTKLKNYLTSSIL